MTTQAQSKERRNALRRELFEKLERGELDLPSTLRMMRKITGRTQPEYAKLVGVSARVLIEFERGQGNPTLATLRKLLAPFGLDVVARAKPHTR